MLIDSHCHLHDTEFFGDQREAAYLESRPDVAVMICVGTDLRSSGQAVEWATTHDGCYAVVGAHPHEARHGVVGIAELAAQPGVVGVGEIGLDYYYGHSSREEQMAALELQLQLAIDRDLPVSFHVRDGAAMGGGRSVWDDFWPIYDNFRPRGVLHSFTDNRVNLEAGLERDLYIGVNGISTFTRDPAQQDLYREAPLAKILLETDAPYLTPAPFRGKMNIPAYVRMVAEHQAQLKGVGYELVAETTARSARELFGLPN